MSSTKSLISQSLLQYFNRLTDEGTNYIRPLVILICGMLLFNLPTVLYKIRLFLNGIMYLVLCFDKSWKKPTDPGSIFGPHLSQGLPVERKTIYFVRHAESTWNETFNVGSHRTLTQFLIGFIPGLIKSLLYEIHLLLSGKMDSWFYDAPLSYYGLTQVEEMAAFLKDKPITDDGSPESDHLKILRADPGAPKSKIICSNLRRAVSTLSFGFSDRLSRRKSDKILVVPFLQEISRNPDTLSITPPHTPIQASWIEKTYKQFQFQTIFNTQTDMSLHTGNKPMDSNGLKRMNDFCEYIFNTSTTNNNQTTPADANNANNYLGGIKEEYIIVGGHSIWFRYFFQTFLPYSVHHVSKNKKIVNCGIITFDLLKAETKRGPKYMIDPKTIKTIYGGF